MGRSSERPIFEWREENMATIFDVAQFIITSKQEISGWYLQKLCYYAQGIYSAEYGNPLFTSDFMKNINGPVCTELIRTSNGAPVFVYTKKTLNKGDARHLSKDELDVLDYVMSYYGEKSPGELEKICLDEPPCKSTSVGEIIPWQVIVEYFKEVIERRDKIGDKKGD